MIKSTSLYYFARISAAICGLLAVAVYTRLATPELYGMFTLVMTGAITIFAICFHWIQSAVLRFLPAEDTQQPASVGAALAGFGLVVVLLTLLALAVAGLDLLPAMVTPDIVVLVMLIAFSYAALEISLAIVHARQKPGTYAILLAARGLGSLVLGSLALVLDYGLIGLLIAVGVAHVLPVVFLTLRWRRRIIIQRLRVVGVERMARFGLPLAFVGIASSVIGISDRYLLALFISVEAAGVYAAPYDLTVRSLQVVMVSAFLALSPMVFRSFELDDSEQFQASLRQQAQLMLVTSLPIALIMAASAPLMARLLFGADFRDAAVALIPWIVAATLVQGFQSFYYSYYFTLTQRTLTNAAIVGAGAALNILLNLWLIPAFGPQGAAAATLASFVAVLVVTLLLAKKWLRLPWPMIDMLKIMAACLLAAPFIAIAARMPDLIIAMVLTGAAAIMLFVCLFLVNAADTRTIASNLFAILKRRVSARMVPQP